MTTSASRSPRRDTESTDPVSRVATYRRASTSAERQVYSTDAQQMDLERYVATRPGWVVVRDFEERASGKNLEGRPVLGQLLTAAERGEFDVVLVARMDRWGRNLLDTLKTLEQLEKNGVTFFSVAEGIEANTANGQLNLSIVGSFAQFERKLIIERIVSGNAAKLAQGKPLSRRVGYGLKTDGQGFVAADPETVGVVHRIFDAYVNQNVGLKAIAVALEKDGVPSPGDRAWSAAAVSRVIGNRTLVGELRHRKGWLPGRHEAIVDTELFAQAQAIAAARAHNPSAAASRKGDYVLSGLVRCGRCGGAYAGTSGTGRNGEVFRYYSCIKARSYGPPTCDGPSVPAIPLESAVTEVLLSTYRDTALFQRALLAHEQQAEERRHPLTQELQALEKVRAGKSRTLNRYESDYESGQLDARLYSQRAGTLAAELDGLDARISALRSELSRPVEARALSPEDQDQLLSRLEAAVSGGDILQRKALMCSVVDSIEVHSLEDIRPTLRLFTQSEHGWTRDVEREANQDRFASHHTGWS